MNYLTEIKLFYDWLETHPLSANCITLWHGIMQIATRSGWKSPIEIPSSLLETRTHLERTTIYRARGQLVDHGLLQIHNRGGRAHCTYTILPLSQRVALHCATQTSPVEESARRVEEQFELQSATQSTTQTAEIPIINKKTKLDSLEKEKKKRALLDPLEWLGDVEEPWRGMLTQWFDYKRTRKESYRNELGA